MEQVKFFSVRGQISPGSPIEMQINDWLAQYPNIEITDRQLSTCVTSRDGVFTTVAIFYRPKV